MKAILIGATGLVGSQILALSLADTNIEKIVSLVRRPTGKVHDKLSEHVVDFASPPSFEDLVRGDVLFSALGTLLRKAGSKDAQREVDVEIPLRVARAAAKNGVKTYGLVSSLGADASSSLFYNRIKGELEREVQTLGFERVRIMRPSILLGERNESRPMESLGASVSKVLGFVPGLKRYRPVPAEVVARALLRAATDGAPGVRLYELDDIFALGAP